MYKIGDLVELRSDCGYGSLNRSTLLDHGMKFDTKVPIVAFHTGYDYQVRLPDGYILNIDEKDIYPENADRN